MATNISISSNGSSGGGLGGLRLNTQSGSDFSGVGLGLGNTSPLLDYNPSPLGRHKKSESLMDVFFGKTQPAQKKEEPSFVICTDEDCIDTSSDDSKPSDTQTSLTSVEERVLKPSANDRKQVATISVAPPAGKTGLNTEKVLVVEKNKENEKPEEAVMAPPPPSTRTKPNLNKALPRIQTDRQIPDDIASEILMYTPRNYSSTEQRNFDGVMTPGLRKPSGGARPTSMAGERKSSWGSLVSLTHRNSTVEVAESTNGESERPPSLLSRMSSFNAGPKRVHPAAREKEPPSTNSLNNEFNKLLNAYGLPENIKNGATTMAADVKRTLLRSSRVMSKAPLPPPSRDGNNPPAFGHTRPQMARNQNAREKKKRPFSVIGAALFKGSDHTRARGKTVPGASASPTKKSVRPLSAWSQGPAKASNLINPTTPTVAGPIHANSPLDFTTYLSNKKYTQVEVDWLRRLRRMLRNERLTWVEAFLEFEGLNKIIDLIHDVYQIEYHDNHSGAVLKELIFCLKALYTAPMADEAFHMKRGEIFPLIISIMFDTERKKTPFEYETREAALGLMFTYLSQATPDEQTMRADIIRTYFEDAMPIPKRPTLFESSVRYRPFVSWCDEFHRMAFETGWMWYAAGNKVSVRDFDPEAPFNVAHFPPARRFLAVEGGNVGCVEMTVTNYAALHLDIMNAIIAYTPNKSARNSFRKDLKDSGIEKVMGDILRLAGKGEHYEHHDNLHSALSTYVTAARADGWESWQHVRTGRFPVEKGLKEKGKTMQKIECMYGPQHELPDVGIEDTLAQRKRASVQPEKKEDVFHVDANGSVVLEWDF